MITAQEFRNKYIGKAIDVDGAYGAQCVDLFKQVCYLAGMKPFALGGTGYAEEIAKRFKPLGLDKYFDLVSLANIKYGDWVIWQKGSKDCPVSHVAMFVGKDGNNRIIALGQNQGKPQANEISLSTHGIIGILRLKVWSNSASKPKPTTSTKYKVGTVVCTNTLATSSTGGKVYKGDWKGTITKVIAGAKYPYLLNNGTGWTNDTGIDTDPHVPSTNTGAASTSKPATSKKQTVTLPKTAKGWNVYKTNVTPVIGNECGKLKPSKFGGLTYEILAKPQKDVVTIQTQDYGKVNIYVGKGTGAIIK